MLPFLLSCTPCGPDELETNSGECLPLDDGTPKDTQIEDSDPPLTLSASCEAPSDIGEDPLWMIGQVRLVQDEPGGPLVELLDIAIEGSRAYGVGQGGVQVYEIEDSSNPKHLYAWPPDGHGRFHRVLSLGSGVLALSHNGHGVVIADLSSSEGHELLRIGGKGLEGMAWLPEQRVLLVTQRDIGLLVAQLGEEYTLSFTKVLPGLEAPWGLSELDDGWVYAADTTLGVVPIDARDALNPVLHDGVDAGGEVLDVAQAGGVLYAAMGGRGVAVLDASDPGAPVLVSTLETGGSAVQVSVGDGLLWVADHDGVVVWELADPLAPQLLHRETTEQFALGIEAQGQEAWVADWNLFSGFTVDSSVRAPKLDLPARRIYADPNLGEVQVTLTNRGSADLTLSGALVEGAQVEITVDTVLVSPGEEATLSLKSTPGPIDATLCIASDDPDEPVQELLLQSSDGQTLLGQTAPDFCLPDTTGMNRCLHDYIGQPIVLSYFVTW